MATSPFRSQVELALQTLRGLSPAVVQMTLPLLEQLTPVFLDVAQGRQEFTPSPEESDRMIRTYYNVGKNLLIQFEDDSIDESPRLSAILQSEAAIAGSAQVTLRRLPGSHTQPMSLSAVELPPELARFANESIKSSGALLGARPVCSFDVCALARSILLAYVARINSCYSRPHVEARVPHLCRSASGVHSVRPKPRLICRLALKHGVEHGLCRRARSTA